ncbi:uncharacterized protein IUM83_10682 [Phytophthora cinnamomi]|uniref:uncharacterized protein n=1 Tax=Phytophthora cinnamomi TaxID=4785 RepID=UPI00355A4F8D|nr:hypothetical protein IUM83_10682 [Phytophthora cinnamomi]
MQTHQPHAPSSPPSPPPSPATGTAPSARAGPTQATTSCRITDSPVALLPRSEKEGDESPREDQSYSTNSGGGAEGESSSSEERDDSGDEDLSLESSDEGSDEEALTAESAPSTAESEEDLSNFFFDTDLNAQATEIIQSDQCENHCVQGKAEGLESLLCSLSQTSKQEKNISLYTLLAVFMQVPVDRKRGSGELERFHYYLPFVGQVCRPVFARCYGVVPMTLQRYKKRIRDGNMAVKDHGKLNQNADQVAMIWLVKWFTSFAEEVGEVVPVRVRMQKKLTGLSRNTTAVASTHCYRRILRGM